MRKIAVILVVLIGGAAVFLFLHQSNEQQAAEAASAFYAYEQDGNFSDSWEMFHPLMKEKFDKIDYLQDRAHVFMDHFGVDTFSFSVGETTEIEDWAFENDADTIDTVYQVPVIQVFKGRYGNFTITQNVFVTDVEGEWKVLWNYKK
ncbi:hypothetical protein [Lentibacillus jeotgali]|uniref:hypothetical protein n=1 Tax=Lentibacillus jeotgali TaxID=558169 RepID=UPI0002625CD3|nr:hypothetical protein [Lentibacillus jeotgali]